MVKFCFTTAKWSKSQLHNATKPCSFKVIHHFAGNDNITYDVIARLNGRWPPFFIFLIFKVQVIVYQLAKKILKKVIRGNLSPRLSLTNVIKWQFISFLKSKHHINAVMLRIRRTQYICAITDAQGFKVDALWFGC